jgi:hypothetical protein
MVVRCSMKICFKCPVFCVWLGVHG